MPGFTRTCPDWPASGLPARTSARSSRSLRVGTPGGVWGRASVRVSRRLSPPESDRRAVGNYDLPGQHRVLVSAFGGPPAVCPQQCPAGFGTASMALEGHGTIGRCPVKMLSATLPGHSSDSAASVAVAHVLDDAHGGLEGGGLAPTRFPTMLTGVHPSPGPSVTSAHACGLTAGERCRTGETNRPPVTCGERQVQTS